LQKENDRPDPLLLYDSRERKVVMALGEQHEVVPMYYNEFQSRQGEVEAMAMNFEQRVADAVEKAGLRAKPGPIQKGGIKGTIDCAW
jgi:hypothetical protein